MKDHELKCWPPFFQGILDGTKPFEIRLDDRGFRFGDTLWLREYDLENEDNPYTGRNMRVLVQSIWTDMLPGLKRHHVAMKIKILECWGSKPD